VDEAKMLAARSLIRDLRHGNATGGLQEFEFRVFSQFGDDGIIQYLIHHARVREDRFVEFGVEDYTESNTRFLLMNDNWKGLVMDAGAANIDRVRRDPLYWRYDLTAVQTFVTGENINGLLTESGFTGQIGLLSIDIDGNDYWVWERIDAIDPIIVVVEYNSVFGGARALVVPYDPGFRRTKAHHSNLYWGCSLRALCLLAEQKGYAFVGCNSSGNNAYFVKRARLNGLRTITPQQGFVLSRFRDSRDEAGALTFVGGEERVRLIGHLPVLDVERGVVLSLADAVSGPGEPMA
jgi:hypothetical protein